MAESLRRRASRRRSTHGLRPISGTGGFAALTAFLALRVGLGQSCRQRWGPLGIRRFAACKTTRHLLLALAAHCRRARTQQAEPNAERNPSRHDSPSTTFACAHEWEVAPRSVPTDSVWSATRRGFMWCWEHLARHAVWRRVACPSGKGRAGFGWDWVDQRRKSDGLQLVAAPQRARSFIAAYACQPRAIFFGVNAVLNVVRATADIAGEIVWGVASNVTNSTG